MIDLKRAYEPVTTKTASPSDGRAAVIQPFAISTARIAVNMEEKTRTTAIPAALANHVCAAHRY